jgi:hypothetical protein
MRGWLSIVMAGLVTGPVGAQADQSFRSGQFEQVLLAVSPSGRIVGQFYEERGVGVTFSCEIVFRGQARGRSIAVVATDGEDTLPGRLAATADGIVLTVPGGQQLAGCGMTIGPDIATGLALSRTGAGSWTSLARITAARARLRPSPGAAPGRAYLVRQDVVAVLRRRGSAVEVVFHGARTTRGWVAAAELTPL